MRTSRTSVLRTIRSSFDVLSTQHRSAFIKNIFFSVAQSIIEVVALTALIPLLQIIISSDGSLLQFNTKIPGMLSLPSHWLTPLILIVILFLLKNVTGILLTQFQSTLSHEVSVFFSASLYRQFFQQPWSAYTKGNSAEASRKIRTTPFEFSTYVLQSLLSLITDLATSLMIIFFMMYYDFSILIIMLSVSVPVVLLYHLYQKKVVSRIDHSFRELTPETSVALTQGVDSFAEVQMYDKQQYFIERFIKVRNEASKNLSRLKTAMQIPGRLFETVGIICVASVIYYFKSHSSDHDKLVTVLSIFSIAVYRVLPALNKVVVNLSQVSAYAYTLDELKNGFPGDESKTSVNKETQFQHEITFKSLSFSYGNRSVINNLSGSIAKGDFVVVEGPSGTGKTTLIHLLAGLLTDFSGEILVDGIPLATDQRASWQQHVGYVSQSPTVLQDTIKQNVAFGLPAAQISEAGVRWALQQASLLEFIESLPDKLNTVAGEKGMSLSGGQRQRLVLARALYRQPGILLLDEVTNQLDEMNKMAVLDNLKSLAKKGTTIVLASHENLVKQYANRVLNLDDNTITRLQ